MTILSDRWWGLRELPYVSIADLPTPVRQLELPAKRSRAELWVKHDENTAERYGGNKARKLEYVLGEAHARQADVLITTGAGGSHHALATALYGKEQRFEVHAVLAPQRYSTHAEENLRALHAVADGVHPVRSFAAASAKVAMLAGSIRLKGKRPYVIPPGGSNIPGVIAHVEAGLELARQIESGLMPEPNSIVLAFGTGGTVAGLAVGLASAGLTSRFHAMRVIGRVAANERVLNALVSRTVRHLKNLDPRFPDVAKSARGLIQIDHSEFGHGYGVASPAGRNAGRTAKAAGLHLDQTYTEKAFAGALRLVRSGEGGERVLYIQTLSHPTKMAALLKDVPPLPADLQKLLVNRFA